VIGISTATAIATGYVHSCALLAGGSVQCWGNNTYGQLGNGTSAISTTPQSVSGAPAVIWSSSDTGVANVGANGMVSAISPGTTTITATATNGSVSGSTTLHVVTHTVGGTVSGLSGTVVLANNGGDNLAVVTNGVFTFATALAGGGAYDVSVVTQPSGQTCAVTNGSGTVGSADVSNVAVTCLANSVTPLSNTNASGGGGGGASDPLMLGLLCLTLAVRRAQLGSRKTNLL
jgi:Regulator of chromosome condensation (RCC1) repeat/Bacterial Ig-like domain (group 2)